MGGALVLSLALLAPAAPQPAAPQPAAPGPASADPREPPAPVAVTAPEDATPPTVASPSAPKDAGPTYVPARDSDKVPHERPGPPFYLPEDEARLRQRFGLPARPEVITRKPRWRCLLADPLCGITVEGQAMAAYALRIRQSSVTTKDAVTWSSARAQYDLWLLFPAATRTQGTVRINTVSVGPKGGVIASDSGDLWGNLGLATRVWFGTGAWAPNLEITGALTFKLTGREPGGEGLFGGGRGISPKRSPAGLAIDFAFGLGGMGAIVVGAQYDSPLAREEVPEALRISAAGTFFVGFRGNILWGGPAALALTAHALAGRLVTQP